MARTKSETDAYGGLKRSGNVIGLILQDPTAPDDDSHHAPVRQEMIYNPVGILIQTCCADGCPKLGHLPSGDLTHN